MMLLANAILCFSSASRKLMDRVAAPQQVKSYPISKAQTRTTAAGLTRSLRGSYATSGRGPLLGTAASDYKMSVKVGSQAFNAILDTGSADFAIAADASIGCETFYTDACNGPAAHLEYGSGSWDGRICRNGANVSFAGLEASDANFVAVTSSNEIFHCKGSGGLPDTNNAIVGLGFAGLSTAHALPLLDFVFGQNIGVAKVFSMQCCGYKGGADLGKGHLVVGGVDSSYYTGDFAFTPITEALWYCVDMTGLRYGDVSLMSASSSSSSTLDAVCDTIVDSGTSALQLAPDIYDTFKASLPTSYRPDVCITEDQLVDFPDLTISLAGGVELMIPPTHYTQPQPLSGRRRSGESAGELVSVCRSMYVSRASPPKIPVGHHSQVAPRNILGQVVMEAYYTVFDQENMRVGFAPIDGCTSDTAVTSAVLPLATNCSMPGANCGKTRASGSAKSFSGEMASSFSEMASWWQGLTSTWRYVLIIAGASFVAWLLYLVVMPHGSCRRAVCGSHHRRQSAGMEVMQGGTIVTGHAATCSDLRQPMSVHTANPTLQVQAALAPTAPPLVTPATIPAGWQTIDDPTTGRPYYINPTSGEASWNMPLSSV